MSQFTDAEEARVWMTDLAGRVFARLDIVDPDAMEVFRHPEETPMLYFESVASFLRDNATNEGRVRLYEVTVAAAEAAGSQEAYERIQADADVGQRAADAVEAALKAAADLAGKAGAAAANAVGEELDLGGFALVALALGGLFLFLGGRRR